MGSWGYFVKGEVGHRYTLNRITRNQIGMISTLNC